MTFTITPAVTEIIGQDLLRPARQNDLPDVDLANLVIDSYGSQAFVVIDGVDDGVERNCIRLLAEVSSQLVVILVSDGRVTTELSEGALGVLAGSGKLVFTKIADE